MSDSEDLGFEHESGYHGGSGGHGHHGPGPVHGSSGDLTIKHALESVTAALARMAPSPDTPVWVAYEGAWDKGGGEATDKSVAESNDRLYSRARRNGYPEQDLSVTLGTVPMNARLVFDHSVPPTTMPVGKSPFGAPFIEKAKWIPVGKPFAAILSHCGNLFCNAGYMRLTVSQSNVLDEVVGALSDMYKDMCLASTTDPNGTSKPNLFVRLAELLLNGIASAAYRTNTCLYGFGQTKGSVTGIITDVIDLWEGAQFVPKTTFLQSGDRAIQTISLPLPNFKLQPDTTSNSLRAVRDSCRYMPVYAPVYSEARTQSCRGKQSFKCPYTLAGFDQLGGILYVLEKAQYGHVSDILQEMCHEIQTRIYRTSDKQMDGSYVAAVINAIDFVQDGLLGGDLSNLVVNSHTIIGRCVPIRDGQLMATFY